METAFILELHFESSGFEKKIWRMVLQLSFEYGESTVSLKQQDIT